MVQNLIRRGCEVNYKDSEGMNALHIAAANGFTDCIKILSLEGSDFLFRDE